FSSSFTTTRSGSSATTAATSGSFVPPTAGSSGCSQNRVTPTGVTPHASNVSVIEGTRLTTRTGRPLHPVEELGLLGLVLLGRDHALVAKPAQLLDLLGDAVARGHRARRRRARCARCAWCDRGRLHVAELVADALAHPIEAAVRVDLHLL